MKPTRQLEYPFSDHRERPFKTNSQMMKIMMLILTGIALALPSHAVEPKLESEKKTKLMTDEEVFQGIDADSSGFLSLVEYKNAMNPNNYAKVFKQVDKDGDGKISIVEFKNTKILTSEEAFRTVDADGNGFLSMEEFIHNSRDPEGSTKIFQRLDKESDGKVSLVEFKTPPGKGKKKK